MSAQALLVPRAPLTAAHTQAAPASHAAPSWARLSTTRMTCSPPAPVHSHTARTNPTTATTTQRTRWESRSGRPGDLTP
jgi:hypothetical protein